MPLRTIGALAFMFSLAVGCAAVRGEKETRVDPAALSRVPEQFMGDVRAKETELGRLREERAGQELAVRTAKASKDAADADVSARKAERDRAEAELKAAQATGQTTRVDQAQRMLDIAKMGVEVAEAKSTFEGKNVDLAQARVNVAERRIDVAEAELERARLQALIDSRDNAAREYNAARFDAKVAEERADLTNAQRDVTRVTGEVASAQRDWEMINERYQAALRGGPVG